MKRKSNPMSRQQKVSRAKIGFNGQVLDAFTLVAMSTSGSDGAASNAWKIDCANSVSSIANSVAGLTTFYKEYFYQSVKAEWIPTIGPASALAGSSVYVTYEDNPEHMATYIGGTASGNVNRQLLDSTTKIFNAWERVTINIPLTRRKKMFDVNSTNDNSVDVLDRSTQGMILTGANTSVINSDIGRWKFTFKIQVMGLSAVST